MLGDVSGQPQASLGSLWISVLTPCRSFGETELLTAVRFICQSRKRTLLPHWLYSQTVEESH